MKQIISKAALLSVLSLTLMSSCAREISSDVYTANHIGEVSQTFRGVVINARTVQVREGERLEDNVVGGVAGGVGGAVLGSNIGKGKGRDTATVAGALVGAVLGSMAEKNLKEQRGMEYVVELSNGQLRTVVQGPEPLLSVGQRVLLMVGEKGRSRIFPHNK